MDAVIDANVLFRTLISAGDILEIIFNDNLTLYAPNRLKTEFMNNKQESLEKSKLNENEFNELQALLFGRINFVDSGEYTPFLPKATKLLGNHFKDEDFAVLCLLKNCRIWTYENKIFEIGLGISTNEIKEQLLSEA